MRLADHDADAPAGGHHVETGMMFTVVDAAGMYAVVDGSGSAARFLNTGRPDER